jgi:hypothetical protein
MRTAMDASLAEPRAEAGAGKGLAQHVGASLVPGARLEIWCLWEKIGELECKAVTDTRIELRIRGRFLGHEFDATGKLEIEPRGRCTIALGAVRDPDARYCLQHKRPIVISEAWGGLAPSLRFWADGADTRAELRFTVDRVRPKFDLVLAPPKLST